MHRLAVDLRKKGQVNDSLRRGRELLLGLGRRLAHALHGHRIELDLAMLALELLEQVASEALVEVVAAQVVVTAGGEHLDDVIADADDGDVEGTAAQVVDHDLLGMPVVEAVGKCRGGGLVDDAEHVETRDAAGVLGRLALYVVEIRRNGDDGVLHILAQVSLRVLAQLAQRHGADLLSAKGLAVDVDGPIRAHVALDARDGALGVHRLLTRGNRTDQALALLGEGHDARSGPRALRVGDDSGSTSFDCGHAAVGGAQVDADDCHDGSPSSGWFSMLTTLVASRNTQMTAAVRVSDNSTRVFRRI